MIKKIIIIVLIPSLFIYLTGCYTMQDISKEDLQKSQNSKLLVTTNDGDSLHFWKYSYHIRQDTLFGKLYIENQPSVQKSIPLKDISSMQTEQLNAVNTVLAVLGSTALFLGVIILIGGLIATSSLEHIFSHWQ